MATGSASQPARSAGPVSRTRPRRTPDPARRRLGGAVVLVMLGSFLPWVSTTVGNVSGGLGPGLWTFYAAMLGLAGVMVPVRRLAGVQAAILAVVAVALPVWQVVHLLQLVGFSGWMPGPGLVLVFGGGVLAGSCAWRILRTAPEAPPAG